MYPVLTFIGHLDLCCQVVEKPCDSGIIPDAATAYQYQENVKKFLVAVEEMGLPTFEVFDLEQVAINKS